MAYRNFSKEFIERYEEDRAEGRTNPYRTSEAGATESIACDTVIEAMDMLPNSSLLDGISVGETYAVGDCAEPYNIADAIFTGNLAGRAI